MMTFVPSERRIRAASSTTARWRGLALIRGRHVDQPPKAVSDEPGQESIRRGTCENDRQGEEVRMADRAVSTSVRQLESAFTVATARC
jgi:hypothetical protein